MAVLVDDRKTDVDVSATDRMFQQFKKELLDQITGEASVAAGAQGISGPQYVAALKFMAGIISKLTLTMAVELRPPGAEKALTFICTPWTEADRTWLDTFAVFDHRTNTDMKIVWLPKGKDEATLRTMYQKLQSLGCSPALKEAFKTHGPQENKPFSGRYLWFWNGA